MLTRREMIVGTVAAGAMWRAQKGLAQGARQNTTINFDVPAGACDCHTHIFGDPAKFPFVAERLYTPEPALPEEMAVLHRGLKLQRVVIVTPSVYGTDNSCTLYGIKARGADARGVAVIDEKTPESELDAMGRAGVCGIRVNLATGGISDPAVGRQRLQTAINRVKDRKWHIQMYTTLAMVSAIRDLIGSSPVPVVIDHFGGARGELGVDQPGFADLVALVKSGHSYVKISGAYRSSNAAPDYVDVAPLAKALIAANSDRIVWGTDWPHPDVAQVPGRKPTDVSPRMNIDDGRLLNQLALWAPDAATRKKILVDNPAQLYGF
jgi:predicted TIM-barrel fold metal-dependent hydrolase